MKAKKLIEVALLLRRFHLKVYVTRVYETVIYLHFIYGGHAVLPSMPSSRVC